MPLRNELYLDSLLLKNDFITVKLTPSVLSLLLYTVLIKFLLHSSRWKKQFSRDH